MTQEELTHKLLDIEDEIHVLIMDGGVMSDSALYAFLHQSEYAMTVALMHTREYNEEFAKININNSNQDLS